MAEPVLKHLAAALDARSGFAEAIRLDMIGAYRQGGVDVIESIREMADDPRLSSQREMILALADGVALAWAARLPAND